MGLITDKVIVSKERSVEVEALFDSGATLCVIDRPIAEKAGFIIGDKVFEIEMANKQKAKYNYAIGEIEIKGCQAPMWASVLVDAEPAFPVIIGAVQMEVMGITLDPENKSYKISCRLPRL